MAAPNTRFSYAIADTWDVNDSTMDNNNIEDLLYDDTKPKTFPPVGAPVLYPVQRILGSGSSVQEGLRTFTWTWGGLQLTAINTIETSFAHGSKVTVRTRDFVNEITASDTYTRWNCYVHHPREKQLGGNGTLVIGYRLTFIVNGASS